QLPEVQAQIARQQQAELVIAAADRAVYNPELGLNYQNSETDTYTVGLSQTLDWGDKRGVATRLAQLEAQILLADIRLERSQMLAERLLALAEQAQGQKALTFAEQQLRFTQAQLNIAEQRFAAGDLSDVELQLLKLELASNTADYALAEQAALVADGKVIELLGVDKLKFREFISEIGQFVSMISPKAELPALTSAHQQVLLAKANALKVKADTAADPTINLGLEREGSDNKLGIGVAIPLQVRNNYSELQSVADKGIAIAEQNYLARERVLTAKQAQFNNALPRLLARYQDWRERVEASGSKAAKSLSEQWRSGDMSTSEYLQSRRQLAASYLVGLNLETAIYQSWLTWMGD
ncbi:TolC family protein, partial [Shewanella xiamenensis]|uniref:TolC family protein n=1 Tax=Shewanella xiamenensis TaxID=332186 RepID=UPI0035B6EE7E